jgi:hypothetical protein
MESNTVIFDGIEYKLEDMSDEQKAMIAHIQDIDQKIRVAKFSIDQLNVAQTAFMTMLENSLKQ